MDPTLCTTTSCGPLNVQILSRHFGMSTEGDSYDDPVQGVLNDTDSDVSDLSHLDGPNESLYMISGVCVAMLLVGVMIILVAITIR